MTASTQHSSHRLTMTSRANSSPCLYEGAALQLSAPLPGGRVNAAISRMLDGARLTSRLWSEDIYKPPGLYSKQPLTSRRKIGDPPLSFNPTSLSYTAGGYAQSGTGARDRLLQRYADRALQGAAPVPRKTLSMRQKSEMTSRRLQEHLVDEVADRLRRELGLLQDGEQEGEDGGGLRAIDYGTNSMQGQQGHAGSNAKVILRASTATSLQGAQGHVAIPGSNTRDIGIQRQSEQSGANTQAIRDTKTVSSNSENRTTVAGEIQTAPKVTTAHQSHTTSSPTRPIGSPKTASAATDNTSPAAKDTGGGRPIAGSGTSTHTDQHGSHLQQTAGTSSTSRTAARRRVRHRTSGTGRATHQRHLSASLTDLTSAGRAYDVTRNGAGSDIIVLDVSREDGGVMTNGSTRDSVEISSAVLSANGVSSGEGLSVGSVHDTVSGVSVSSISGDHSTVTSTNNNSNHNTLHSSPPPPPPPHTTTQPPPPPSYRDASSYIAAGTRRSRTWRDANNAPGVHGSPVPHITSAPGDTLDGQDSTIGVRYYRYGGDPDTAVAGIGPSGASDTPHPSGPHLAAFTMGDVYYYDESDHRAHTPVSGVTGSQHHHSHFSPRGVAGLNSRGTGVHISGSMSRTAEMIRDKRVPPMPSGPPPPPPTHRLFLNNSHLEEDHGMMVVGDPDPDPDLERLNDSGVGVDEERSKEITNSIDQEVVPEGVNPKHLPILRNKRVFEKELACRLEKKMELEDQLIGDLRICMEKETMREKVESTVEVVQNIIRTNIYNDRRGNRIYSVLVDLGKFYRHMLHNVEGHTVTIEGTTFGDPEFALTKELSIEFPESVIMEKLSVQQIGPTVEMVVPFKRSELMTDLISLVDKVDQDKKQQGTDNVLDDAGSNFSDQTSVYSELNDLAEKLPELPTSPPPPSPLIKEPKPMRRRRKSNKGQIVHVNGSTGSSSSPTHINDRKVEMSSAKLKMASDKETWLKTRQIRKDQKEDELGRSGSKATFIDTLHNGHQTDTEPRKAGRTFVDTVDNGRHKAGSISSIDSVYGSEDSVDDKWSAVYHHSESGGEKGLQLNVFEPIEKTESKVEMGDEFVTIRHVPVGRPPVDIHKVGNNSTVSCRNGTSTSTGGEQDQIDAAPPPLATAERGIESDGKAPGAGFIQFSDHKKVLKTGFIQEDEKVSPELVTSVLESSPQCVYKDLRPDGEVVLQVEETPGPKPPAMSLRDEVGEEEMHPRDNTHLKNHDPVTISIVGSRDGSEDTTSKTSEYNMETESECRVLTSDGTPHDMLDINSVSSIGGVDKGNKEEETNNNTEIAVTNEGLSPEAPKDVTPNMSPMGGGVDMADIIPVCVFTSHPEVTLTESCPADPPAPIPTARGGARGGGSPAGTDGTRSTVSVKGHLNQGSESACVTAAGVTVAGVTATGVTVAGVTATGVTATGVTAAGVTVAGVTATGVTATGVTAASTSRRLKMHKKHDNEDLVVQTPANEHSTAGERVLGDDTKVKDMSVHTRHGNRNIVLNTQVSDDDPHGKVIEENIKIKRITVLTKQSKVKPQATVEPPAGKRVEDRSEVREMSVTSTHGKGHLVKTQVNDSSPLENKLAGTSAVREMSINTQDGELKTNTNDSSHIGKEIVSETAEVRDISGCAEMSERAEHEVHQSCMRVHLRSETTPDRSPCVSELPDTNSELSERGKAVHDTPDEPKVYQAMANVQLQHKEDQAVTTVRKQITTVRSMTLETKAGSDQHVDPTINSKLPEKAQRECHQGSVTSQATQEGKMEDRTENQHEQGIIKSQENKVKSKSKYTGKEASQRHGNMQIETAWTIDEKAVLSDQDQNQGSDGIEHTDNKKDLLSSIDVKKVTTTEDRPIEPPNQSCTRLNDSSDSTHTKDSTNVTDLGDMTREQIINVNDTDVYYVRPKRRVKKQQLPQEPETLPPQDNQEEVYVRPRRRAPRPKSEGGFPELNISPSDMRKGDGDNPPDSSLHGGLRAAREEVKVLSKGERTTVKNEAKEGSVLSRYKGRSLTPRVMSPTGDPPLDIQNKASVKDLDSSDSAVSGAGTVDNLPGSTDIKVGNPQGTAVRRIRSDHGEAKRRSLFEDKGNLKITPSVLREGLSRQTQHGDGLKAASSESNTEETDGEVGAKANSGGVTVRSEGPETAEVERPARSRYSAGVELREEQLSSRRPRDTTNKRHTFSGDISQLQKPGLREPADKPPVKPQPKPGVSLLKLRKSGSQEPADKPIVKSELLGEQDRVVKLRLMFEKLGNGRGGQKAAKRKLGAATTTKGTSGKEGKGLMEKGKGDEEKPKYTTEFKLNM